jgi:hypothetical protein
MTQFFDLLYTRFLLRDIIAKNVPALLLFVVIFQASDLSIEDTEPYLKPLREIFSTSSVYSFVCVALLYAIGFAVGILLQGFGEFIRLVRIHPWDGPSGRVKQSLMVAHMFLANTKDNEIARQQRERFIVLKEMTGNLSVVFLVAALAVVSKPIISFVESNLIARNWLHTLLIFSTFVGLCVLTACGNRYHINQQRIWENEYTKVDRKGEVAR